MSIEKYTPRFVSRVLLASLAATTLHAAQSSSVEAQSAPVGYDISLDYDQDGIPNTIDTELFIPAPPDVDGDGILNYADRNPYIADPPDADFDGILNQFDSQPYVNNGFSVVLTKTVALDCNVAKDNDCDGIPDKQDRFYKIPDLPDADFDGIYNELDPFPYVPYVRTDMAALLNNDPNYCNTFLDNDCDGIINTLDNDDFIAEYPDVDGDGIANKFDNFPFHNFNVASGYVQAQLEPYGRFHFPITLDVVSNTYVASQDLSAFVSYDSDGDRIADAHDPYITLYDSDNNGRSDSIDAARDQRDRVEDVDYYLEGLEEKRLEEGVLADRAAQQRREEQWLEELQEERRYEQAAADKIADQLAVERRVAERRRQEGVLADRAAQQRREERWRLEEKERQRLDDVRRGEDRFNVLYDDDSYLTQRAQAKVLEERRLQQDIIDDRQNEQLAAQRAENARLERQRLDDQYQQERDRVKRELQDDLNSQDYDDDWYEWNSFENETYDYYNDSNYDWYKDY